MSSKIALFCANGKGGQYLNQCIQTNSEWLEFMLYNCKDNFLHIKSLVFADITTDAFHDKPCKGSFSICHNATTIQDTCLAIHLPYCFKDIVHVRFLGTDGGTKSDEFSEKFQRRGGGSFSIQKFMLQILDLYIGFLDVFQKIAI